jgi:exopolyphosphatase/guanosine-5'-triphosphate,3'-diphosphate pyrophosphatase
MPDRPIAAIDAGSNSVHLLVAAEVQGALLTVDEDAAFLGLGGVVDAQGRIPEDLKITLLGTFAAFLARARSWNPSAVVMLGTEPLRRAENAEEVRAAVQGAFGLPLHVLTHDEEGQLTALGALGGTAPKRGTLVVDIGGGSSEWVYLEPGSPPRVGVIATGTNRLTERFIRSDPPTKKDLDSLGKEARAHAAELPDLPVAELHLAGGTASKLRRFEPAPGPEQTLPSRLFPMIRRQILAEDTAALALRYRLRLRRAQLLPAGAALVEAVMEHYGVDTALIADASPREGAIRALRLAGDDWRERLPSLLGH